MIRNTIIGSQLIMLAELADYPISIVSSTNPKEAVTKPIVYETYEPVLGIKISSERGYKIVIYKGKYLNFLTEGVNSYGISSLYQISRTKALAHELGHAVSQRDDAGNLININRKNEFGKYIIDTWENPIMYSLEKFNRTSYFLLGL